MSGIPSKILMTGATGFIGQHLTRRLLSLGCEVSAIVLPEENALLHEGVDTIPGDIADTTVVKAAVHALCPKLIIHLAAVGVTHPSVSLHETCRINVQGTINLIEAAHNVSALQRLVFVGSSFEYGARRSDDMLDPFNAYGASKVAAWAYARAAYNAWQLPMVWVRPFQVYGPGQPDNALIPSAIHAALSGHNFPMTAGAQQRDFIYIDDIVDGLATVITAPDIAGRSLDLGSGHLTPLIKVVQDIWHLTDARGRMMPGSLPYRHGEVPVIASNPQRTRLLTGWEATVPLQEGLQLTIDAIRTAQGKRPAEGMTYGSM